MPYEVENDDGIDELFESSDENNDESSDEAAPRSWGRPRTKVASGRNLYAARPQTQYVTQQQLQTALAKVGSQVRTNGIAIGQVGGRVAGVTAAMKKESSDRKKEITQLKSNLSQTQQMAAIMPLLTQGQSVTLTNAAGNLPVGTKVMVDSGNMMNLMMPMLMYSSIGDGGSATATGGGGLFGGGGGDGMGGMMPMFMIMALSGSLGSR